VQKLMKLKSIFLATLLASSGYVQAADLLETFRAAQANDPVIAAARATQQAGKEKLSQGRSLQ
jgi:outer membrane protein